MNRHDETLFSRMLAAPAADEVAQVRDVDPGVWFRVTIPVVGGTAVGGGLVVLVTLAVPPAGVALAVAVTAAAVGFTAGAARQAQDEARQAPAVVRAARLALEAPPAASQGREGDEGRGVEL
ncbi:hypothetical protein ABZ644_25065 [Nocardiopsis alba]|uniref:hypothetical protein n=1 Tax=Nocardiopsis alba TaxID=53437 RepID=UPI00340C67DA